MFPPLLIRSILELKDDLLDFIYPQSCPVCKKPLSRGQKDVCDSCWTNLAILSHPFCPYCLSFFEEDDSILEHDCTYLDRSAERKILAVRALGTFDDHYRILIHRIKYDKKIPLARRLARSLGEETSKGGAFLNCDLVMPVPLHRSRKRERGFNQSEILAEGVAHALNTPVDKNIMKRRKNTKDQTDLNAEQRKQNVRDAFVVLRPAKVVGKSVILVDDVMTTGATLNECARMLLEAGAIRVFATTLAVVAE